MTLKRPPSLTSVSFRVSLASVLTKPNILDDYWHDIDTSTISWISSPLHMTSKFEVKWFHYIPLTSVEHQPFISRNCGSLAKWVGALMNLFQGIHIDLHYAKICLSTYMSHTNLYAYEALHNLMIYLLHHPHLPIMYPWKWLRLSPLKCHFQCGGAEITSVQDHLQLQAYNDSDIGRDLLTPHSVNASVHDLNGVSIVWTWKKQPLVSGHSNGDEVRALFQGVKKT